MRYLNLVKLLVLALFTTVISAVFSLPPLKGLIFSAIGLSLARVYCYFNYSHRGTFSEIWGYSSYLQNKSALKLIRVVYPKAGWYLFTDADLQLDTRYFGPFASDRPMKELIDRTIPKGSTIIVKFLLNPPEESTELFGRDVYEVNLP